MIAVDIGNTNILVSLHNGSSWYNSIRYKTKTDDINKELENFLSGINEDYAVISSVVPKLTDRVLRILSKHSKTKPVIISKKIKTNLDISTIPDECGSDIICNMIAAHNLYPKDYVLVADFGTAFTTVTINPKGQCLGVTIAPGMMTSVRALFENTAQLPEIQLDLPSSVLGRDTVGAIRSGVVFGFTGQLKAIIDQVEKELNQKVRVICTGGFSRYVQPYVQGVDHVDINHTLEGARLACIMNN